jgi:hypothetical protein
MIIQTEAHPHDISGFIIFKVIPKTSLYEYVVNCQCREKKLQKVACYVNKQLEKCQFCLLGLTH